MLSKHSEEEDDEDMLAAMGILLPFLCLPDPVPQLTSILTGDMRFEEYMTTENENDFFDNVKIDRDNSFLPLVELLTMHGGLTDGVQVSAGQKIMIFIDILTGLRNRKIKKCWQHSGLTVSLVFHEVKRSLLSVRHLLFETPKATDPVIQSIFTLYCFLEV